MAGKTGVKHLVPQQAQSARERCARGDKVADIARDMGVTPDCIYKIVIGKAHKTAPGPIRSTRPRAVNTKHAPDAALVDELASLRPNAVPSTQVAS